MMSPKLDFQLAADLQREWVGCVNFTISHFSILAYGRWRCKQTHRRGGEFELASRGVYPLGWKHDITRNSSRGNKSLGSLMRVFQRVHHSIEMAAVVRPAPTEQRISLSFGSKLRVGFDQQHGNAGAGDVADAFDVEKESLERDAAAFGGGFEDSAVGLMRKNPRIVRRRPSADGHRFADDPRKTIDGVAEQRLAVEPNPGIEMRAAVEHHDSRALRAGPSAGRAYRRRE